jgi:creatinine amidohydrolase/Fe(II)-dependent formamide hydrolase-like protein
MYDEPRPIAAGESVWMEDLTWMEVRDLLADGWTTAIVSTGGIEQNGPYLVTGKHNVVMQGACERIAKALTRTLCAPVIKLVPGGPLDGSSGHMRYSGTLSLRPETYEMVLEDVTRSLATHGFTDIVLIGDSGGNQDGMEAVAERLSAEWASEGSAVRAHYIPEFYTYPDVVAYMEDELGAVQTDPEGIHDDFAITSMMMVVDPELVRFDQRVEAGRASINGVSLLPTERALEVGEALFQFRTDRTVKAIRRALGESAAGDSND